MRNERAEHDQAEELRAKWAEWSDALEDDAVLARQVLGKVLAGAPIYVRPGVTPKTWFFVGLASFEAVIRGAVRPGAIATYASTTTRTPRPSSTVVPLGDPGSSRGPPCH